MIGLAAVLTLVTLGALGAALLGLRPDSVRQAVEREYRAADSRDLALPDGAIAHVRESGPPDAPAVLMLHGFASSAWAWEGWAEALKDRYRVIRLDLPAHGFTKMHAQSDLSAAGQVAFLAAVLDALALPAAIVCGNSMGGALAWRFAAQYPARVKALILIDAVGRATARAARQFAGWRQRLGNPVLRWLLRWGGGPIPMGWSMRLGVADPRTITPAKVRRADLLWRLRENREALPRALAAGVDGDGPRPEAVRAPTLVMHGARDRLVPLSEGKALAAAIPGARLIVYPDLGHIPHEEDPARTAADALAFLAGLGADKTGRPGYM
jgi:pimeloyl-ACP methyl ester carboxylesterase